LQHFKRIFIEIVAFFTLRGAFGVHPRRSAAIYPPPTARRQPPGGVALDYTRTTRAATVKKALQKS